MHKEQGIRTALDFSTATLEGRKKQRNAFGIVRKNNFQPGMHYPTKLLIKCQKRNKDILRYRKSQNIFLSRILLQDEKLLYYTCSTKMRE